MGPLAWPAILLSIGLAMLLAEIFVPSGGVLGFLSVAAISVAIALAFNQNGMQTGFWFILITFVSVPTIMILAFRWWPETRLGRRLLPPVWTSEEVLPDNAERRSLKELVGKVGRAKTLMLPSGAVVIEGRTVDAVSEGLPIEAGDPVRVVEVHGTRVVVRPAEEEPPPVKHDDVLSRPLDSLGLDFDDPMA